MKQNNWIIESNTALTSERHTFYGTVDDIKAYMMNMSHSENELNSKFPEQKLIYGMETQKGIHEFELDGEVVDLRGTCRFTDYTVVYHAYREDKISDIKEYKRMIVCGRLGFEYDYDIDEHGDYAIMLTKILPSGESYTLNNIYDWETFIKEAEAYDPEEWFDVQLDQYLDKDGKLDDSVSVYQIAMEAEEIGKAISNLVEECKRINAEWS